MSLGMKIKQLRQSKGLTQEQLGELIGVKKSAIAKYENNRVENLKRATIQKLADIFEVPPSFFFNEEDSHIYEMANVNFFYIPLYDPICCGNGGFDDDNIIEMIAVPSKGLNPSLHYFAQYADGESMKDAGINNGDLLVFERTDRVDNGVIGCFCVDENTAMCKKFKMQDNIVVLQPMNSDFDPIPIDPLNSNFRCIGKLKKVIKDFEWEE